MKYLPAVDAEEVALDLGREPQHADVVDERVERNRVLHFGDWVDEMTDQTRVLHSDVIDATNDPTLQGHSGNVVAVAVEWASASQLRDKKVEESELCHLGAQIEVPPHYSGAVEQPEGGVGDELMGADHSYRNRDHFESV